jgi:hypothetical protein
MSETTQNSETLPIVRAQVADILKSSPAFRALPEAQRLSLANDMVKVAHFIVGDKKENTPTSATLASSTPLRPIRPIGGQQPQQQQRPDPARQTASERLKASGATAAREGVAAYGDLVSKVDFPAFVAGLIHGVFDAIVSSSIQQMEAYANLVKNVSKSVDQYMKDNITPNQARDYLAERYPDHLEVDITGQQPKLKPREGADENSLPDFFKELGLDTSVPSLDEETVEQTLVPAARRRMAMDRQQLLATMVMMGINRLVVTDGRIEASVLFELDTKDSVTRHYSTTADRQHERDSQSESGGEGSYSRSSGGWFSDDVERKSTWYNKNTTHDNAKFKVSTTRSEDSTSKVDLHAKLGGKVNINFKSETFPLDRMVDVLQINQIQEKVPGNTSAAQPVQPATAQTPASK